MNQSHKTLVKSEYQKFCLIIFQKNNFLIFQPKHMLWVLKRTVSMRRVFLGFQTYAKNTRPRSAVGNVSGNRCESDCRSMGRKFNPDPVSFFRGD